MENNENNNLEETLVENKDNNIGEENKAEIEDNSLSASEVNYEPVVSKQGNKKLIAIIASIIAVILVIALIIVGFKFLVKSDKEKVIEGFNDNLINSEEVYLVMEGDFEDVGSIEFEIQKYNKNDYYAEMDLGFLSIEMTCFDEVLTVTAFGETETDDCSESSEYGGLSFDTNIFNSSEVNIDDFIEEDGGYVIQFTEENMEDKLELLSESELLGELIYDSVDIDFTITLTILNQDEASILFTDEDGSEIKMTIEIGTVIPKSDI